MASRGRDGPRVEEHRLEVVTVDGVATRVDLVAVVRRAPMIRAGGGVSLSWEAEARVEVLDVGRWEEAAAVAEVGLVCRRVGMMVGAPDLLGGGGEGEESSSSDSSHMCSSHVQSRPRFGCSSRYFLTVLSFAQ